jgi:hypothetical protein
MLKAAGLALALALASTAAYAEDDDDDDAKIPAAEVEKIEAVLSDLGWARRRRLALCVLRRWIAG